MDQTGESSEDKNEKWMDELKMSGSLPLLDLEDCANGWSSPPGDLFQVRGSDYLTTKLKIPGGEWLLKPLGFDWLKSSSKIFSIMTHPSSRVMSAINNLNKISESPPFVWVFNLQVPSRENHSAIFYFVTQDPIPEDSLMDRFIKGDDTFRNARLKLIANVVKGPWIVKAAVGEQAICILGRALNCKYIVGANFFEVDVDIGSSMVANAIVHLAIGYITSLTVDLAFLIEGQQENELPEKILGAVRFSELQLESAVALEEIPKDIDSSGTEGEEDGYFSARLWKSIGQGFSTLLSNPNQNSSNSNPDSF